MKGIPSEAKHCNAVSGTIVSPVFHVLNGNRPAKRPKARRSYAESVNLSWTIMFLIKIANRKSQIPPLRPHHFIRLNNPLTQLRHPQPPFLAFNLQPPMG